MRTLLVAVAVLLSLPAAAAAGWLPQGGSIDGGGLEGAPSVTSVGGYPFVAYLGPDDEVRVSFDDGTGWARIGGALNVNPAAAVSADGAPQLIDDDGQLYVVWTEAGIPHIKGQNGLDTWVDAGDPFQLAAGEKAEWVSGESLGNHPIVAWVTRDPLTGTSRLRAARQTPDESWLAMGGAINADPLDQITDVKLATVDNVPHVAYREVHAGVARVRVQRFDAGVWSAVGGPIGAGVSSPTLAATDQTGATLAWYEHDGTGTDLRAARWDGTAWNQLGGPINLNRSGTYSRPSLAPYAADFIAYAESVPATSARRVRVFWFNGATWRKVDADLNRDPAADGTLPSLTTIAGRPYVVWGEAGSVFASGLDTSELDGSFSRAWGQDVVTGAPTGFEACEVAATCKAGTAVGDDGGTLDPGGAAVGPDGNVYVVDTAFNRVQVFTPDGGFLRAWGMGVNTSQPSAFGVCTAASACDAGDPGPQGGALNTPQGIAVGADGHVFVTESQAARVSEFTAAGTFVRLWGRRVNAAAAGDGFEVCAAADAAQCTVGLASTAAHGGEMQLPRGVAADSAGNVYVADWGNHRVQKFDAARQFVYTVGASVNDVAGAPSPNLCDVAADCKAGAASGTGGGFDRPSGLAVGADDHFYVGEDNGYRVSQFTPAGDFRRVWGKGVNGGTAAEQCNDVPAACTAGVSGGAGGEFGSVGGVATDADGRVYVTDGNRVQRFDAVGNFERAWGRDVAGSAFGVCTSAPDCGPGQPGGLGGELSGPLGLGVSRNGFLFVADHGNDRIVRFEVKGSGPQPPAAPSVTGVTPASPAADNSPEITGTAPVGTTVTLYGNATCTGTPLATGTAAAFASPGLTITVADDSTTTVHATATNAAGTSACSTTSVTYVENSTLPTVRFTQTATSVPEAVGTIGFILERTGSTAGQTTVEYATANGTAAAPADFTAGTGTVTFAPGETQERIEVTYVDDALDEGDETMSLTLSQPSLGAVIGTPGTLAITIADDDRIDTVITAGPDGATNDPTPEFAFTADPAAGATFECAVDGGAFGPCTSPHTPAALADGEHTFRVRAVRPNGAKDAAPATRGFIVDTVPPKVLLSVQAVPGRGEQLGSSARYTGAVRWIVVGDDGSGSQIAETRCRLDPPAPPTAFAQLTEPCNRETSAVGDHTIHAAVSDRAGNVSGTPVSAAFRIVAVPDTEIFAAPGALAVSVPYEFTFRGTPAGVAYECSLDGAAFSACASPRSYPSLPVGGHRFRVRAVSADGAVDPSPAERAFEVGSRNANGSCSGSFPFGDPVSLSGNFSLGGRECTALDEACPGGSRCTLTLTAGASDRDVKTPWRGEGEARVPGFADTTYCYSTPDEETGLYSADDPKPCARAQTLTGLGPGRVLAKCTAARSFYGAGFHRRGPDELRLMSCNATLKVEPAVAFVAVGGNRSASLLLPSAGVLTVTGAGGRSGARAAAVKAPFATIRRTVAAAGVVRVAFKLRARPKRTLKRRGRLALNLRIGFAPTGGEPVARTQRVVLRRPQPRVRPPKGKGVSRRCRLFPQRCRR